MVLVLDVGNTNIKCGLFLEDKLEHSWRMTTKKDQTSDEIGIKICSFLEHLALKRSDLKAIIMSSVIPSINYTLEHMCRIYFDKAPMVVGPGIKTGINILYENPRELGSDRIVNAVAAYELYGGPCITVDFGTATTYGAVSAEGEFLGGAISPGIKISADALTVTAAKLPRVELAKTPRVINRSTISCMQSGIYYGFVGQVEYILKKMRKELGGEATIVATGGLSSVIAMETKSIDYVNPTLTLLGLYFIYKKNI